MNMIKSFGFAIILPAIACGFTAGFALPTDQPSVQSKIDHRKSKIENWQDNSINHFPLIMNGQLVAGQFSSSLDKEETTAPLWDEAKTEPSTRQTLDPETAETFRRVMEEAIGQNWHDLPMGEIMQAIAKQFLGASYQAGLLDKSEQENLVISLKEFDCLLFIETVLALARGVAVQDYSEPTFADHIRDQRYLNGQMEGYCSRLHYFSAWIDDNQKRQNVENIGSDLSGVTLNKKLNFMSTHRQSYPRLVSDDATYQCIVAMEDNLQGVTLNYIPQNQIRSVYESLQPGDIVGIATNLPGLDVTHTGLVYRTPDGNMGLIHASPIGEVTIAKDLQRYVGNVKNAIGILVVRPIDPRQASVKSIQQSSARGLPSQP
ncbi:N-acetylmuramoyl-L-alanine amidase-like domain-containing protein [Lyngbya aestuarii]|uniref:N-acetylmuramoyl-L-alanine amidase-like domain-containing protein n=1 Tax=Lyngbya aestuarii TaxID=118322 RepID=UPI00403D61F0